MKRHPYTESERFLRIKSFDLNSPETNRIGPPERSPADGYLISQFEQGRDTHILLDAGKMGQGKAVILPYLLQNGIVHIDHLILSHPHRDHFGGMIDILQDSRITVGQFIYSPVDDALIEREHGPNYELWLLFRNLLQGSSQAKIGKIIGLDPSHIGRKLDGTGKLQIEIIDVQDSAVFEAEDVPNLNNASLVLKLEYGHFTALFAGDCGAKQSNAIMRSPQLAAIGNIHLLKAAHHGGDESMTPELLDICSPAIVVIPCNDTVVWHRPSFIGNLHHFSRKGAKVYRCDAYRQIDLYTDGSTLSCEASTAAFRELAYFQLEGSREG